MESLLKVINDYYLEEGHHPIVHVSPEFYDKNAGGLIKSGLAVGIEIEIDDLIGQWKITL